MDNSKSFIEYKREELENAKAELGDLVTRVNEEREELGLDTIDSWYDLSVAYLDYKEDPNLFEYSSSLEELYNMYRRFLDMKKSFNNLTKTEKESQKNSREFSKDEKVTVYTKEGSRRVAFFVKEMSNNRVQVRLINGHKITVPKTSVV